MSGIGYTKLSNIITNTFAHFHGICQIYYYFFFYYYLNDQTKTLKGKKEKRNILMRLGINDKGSQTQLQIMMSLLIIWYVK